MATNSVFISYSAADQEVAIELNGRLKKLGSETWIADFNLTPGHSWLTRAAEAISKCSSILILLGSSGPGHLQLTEIDLAVGRQAKERDLPVIPVLLPGAGLEVLELVPSLTRHNFVDFTQGVSQEGLLRLFRSSKGPKLQDRPRIHRKVKGKHSTNKELLRIAIIPKGNTHSFWNYVQIGARCAEKENSKVVVDWRDQFPESDETKQETKLRECLEDGVAGVCLAPINQRSIGKDNDRISVFA